MSKDREAPLMQEMGPKKYNKLVQDTNKFYDKYKAGKRDPKTGDFYYHIGVKPPRNSKTGRNAGSIECPVCNNYISVKTSTVMVVCTCGSTVKFKFDKENQEIYIEEVINKKG